MWQPPAGIEWSGSVLRMREGWGGLPLGQALPCQWFDLPPLPLLEPLVPGSLGRCHCVARGGPERFPVALRQGRRCPLRAGRASSSGAVVEETVLRCVGRFMRHEARSRFPCRWLRSSRCQLLGPCAQAQSQGLTPAIGVGKGWRGRREFVSQGTCRPN